jgi:hypothetical protein
MTTQRGKKERHFVIETMKTPFYARERKISSDIYKLEAS